MRDHLAEIRGDQVLAVHPAVLLPLVALHLQGHLHLNQVVQIAIAVVKIFRRVADHPNVVVQRVKSRKVVKPVIHAGFVPSR
jgi:hypothetical protein